MMNLTATRIPAGGHRERYGQRTCRDQHFMTDRQLLEEMVARAGVTSADTVLEIGAGTGNLTRVLERRAGRVIAVEADPAMEQRLQAHAGRHTEIIIGNALPLLKQLRFTKIVANPPYAIAEPLLRQMAFLDFRVAVLTLPAGFVQTLLKKTTPLSLFCRAFFEIDVILPVPKTSFSPPPRVDSMLISIQKRAHTTEQAFLSFETKKTGNALEEALIRSCGLTRRQAALLRNPFLTGTGSPANRSGSWVRQNWLLSLCL